MEGKEGESPGAWWEGGGARGWRGIKAGKGRETGEENDGGNWQTERGREMEQRFLSRMGKSGETNHPPCHSEVS